MRLSQLWSICIRYLDRDTYKASEKQCITLHAWYLSEWQFMSLRRILEPRIQIWDNTKQELSTPGLYQKPINHGLLVSACIRNSTLKTLFGRVNRVRKSARCLMSIIFPQFSGVQCPFFIKSSVIFLSDLFCCPSSSLSLLCFQCRIFSHDVECRGFERRLCPVS